MVNYQNLDINDLNFVTNLNLKKTLQFKLLISFFSPKARAEPLTGPVFFNSFFIIFLLRATRGFLPFPFIFFN